MRQDANVLVASVSIMQENKVLMIQETKPAARNKWNFPSGRLEPGEYIAGNIHSLAFYNPKLGKGDGA